MAFGTDPTLLPEPKTPGRATKFHRRKHRHPPGARHVLKSVLFRSSFRRRRGYCRERVDVVFLTGVDLHRERALQAQTGPLDPLADAIAAKALGDAA